MLQGSNHLKTRKRIFQHRLVASIEAGIGMNLFWYEIWRGLGQADVLGRPCPQTNIAREGEFGLPNFWAGPANPLPRPTCRIHPKVGQSEPCEDQPVAWGVGAGPAHVFRTFWPPSRYFQCVAQWIPYLIWMKTVDWFDELIRSSGAVLFLPISNNYERRKTCRQSVTSAIFQLPSSCQESPKESSTERVFLDSQFLSVIFRFSVVRTMKIPYPPMKKTYLSAPNLHIVGVRLIHGQVEKFENKAKSFRNRRVWRNWARKTGRPNWFPNWAVWRGKKRNSKFSILVPQPKWGCIKTWVRQKVRVSWSKLGTRLPHGAT